MILLHLLFMLFICTYTINSSFGCNGVQLIQCSVRAFWYTVVYGV